MTVTRIFTGSKDFSLKKWFTRQWKCTHPQAIQDVDVYYVLRNRFEEVQHSITRSLMEVNGCHQNEISNNPHNSSPSVNCWSMMCVCNKHIYHKDVFNFKPVNTFRLNQERNMPTVYKQQQCKRVLNKYVWCERTTGDGLFY